MCRYSSTNSYQCSIIDLPLKETSIYLQATNDQPTSQNGHTRPSNSPSAQNPNAARYGPTRTPLSQTLYSQLTLTPLRLHPIWTPLPRQIPRPREIPSKSILLSSRHHHLPLLRRRRTNLPHRTHQATINRHPRPRPPHRDRRDR